MKTKPDYCFKSVVLQSGLCQTQKDISKSLWANYILTATGEIVPSKYDLETAENLRSFHLEKNPEWYKEAEKINHASYERVKRLKNRLSSFIEDGKCCFLTLTFRDEILDKTSPETRRKYISRFLKSFGVPYVANKDFGKDFGREHYHAVIKTARIDMQSYDYGFIFAETIHQTKDNVKLAKYIAKLTNHAIKETTKRSVLLYSR